MAIFAVVASSGGTVTNTVVGDNLDDVKAVVGEVVEITETTGPASIGYIWDGSTFTPPAEQL